MPDPGAIGSSGSPAPTMAAPAPAEAPVERGPAPAAVPSPSESQGIPTVAALPRNDTQDGPSGTPAPTEAPDESTTPTCTVPITCEVLAADPSRCDPAKAALIPPDGILLAPTELELREGETAFDLLLRACRQNSIHLEFSETPLYDSAYIEGIGNLYEFDAGELSGWMFSVNGVFPNYGCSQLALQPGDTVCWRYTCDLGHDLGSDMGGEAP